MLDPHPPSWQPLFEPPEKCPTHGLSKASQTACRLCDISDTTDIRVTLAAPDASGIPAGMTHNQLETWSQAQIAWHVKNWKPGDGRHRGRPGSSKVERTCPTCRKAFSGYPSQAKKFCSKSCYAQWREAANAERRRERG